MASLLASRLRQGQVAQGDLAAALTSYQTALAIRDRLAEADPGNAEWQHDLSLSHERIGDVRRAQGDLAAALTSYQTAHAIRDRLAKADPGNAGWQRDLAVSHIKIGEVQRMAAKTKYTCPTCGLNAWSKPDINLVCGDCEERTNADGSDDGAEESDR